MPLWKVYHPVDAYSAEDKKQFAERVTEMYSRIPIPKFYVVMIFEEVAAAFPEDGTWQSSRHVIELEPNELVMRYTADIDRRSTS